MSTVCDAIRGVSSYSMSYTASRRNHATSNGTGNSRVARPASRRTSEVRPSQATVRSARNSPGATGVLVSDAGDASVKEIVDPGAVET